MMVSQMHLEVNEPPPPPLGDLSTRRLVALVLMGQRSGHVAHTLKVRGASIDDARRELRRREVAGVGVRP
ncbi:MAG: hypothetical protein M3R02_08810 [Chloroflexota bacterium]|nr:hypothetical protein [Chloroflexota bacterium]